jgi:hypothetical protein
LSVIKLSANRRLCDLFMARNDEHDESQCAENCFEHDAVTLPSTLPKKSIIQSVLRILAKDSRKNIAAMASDVRRQFDVDICNSCLATFQKWLMTREGQA